ncbi:MAG TPA: hypothetical protein VFG30_18595 [Polyangiales bacterium]|nr:hypothetical protein [Polyangiales bacterium]
MRDYQLHARRPAEDGGAQILSTRTLRNSSTIWTALACLGALGAAASGCGFSSPVAAACGPNATEDFITCALNMAPIVQPGSDTRQIVYQAPGKLRVLHGQSCVSAPRAADSKQFAFRIQQSETLPAAYADSATVFMNGWKLRYQNGDHHVQGFGSAIVNINESRQLDGLQLQWEAGGVLSDQNGDDPYEWCYSYTIVGWTRSSSGFDAVAGERGRAFIRPSDPGNSTALHLISGAARNSYGSGVVLPQGFAMMWDDHGDRHVIQTGFDYGQHYSSGTGEMAWTSRALFKDNGDNNDYYAAELVSTMTYSSPQQYHPVEVSVQTPQGFKTRTNSVSLTPMASDSFCTAVGDSTPTVQQFRIDNVPYAYAVPILTGWELGYLCTDHHVEQMGAAITDFRFERAPDASGGTLFYTLELALGDASGNINYAGASVDVLGMKPLSAGPQPLFGEGESPAIDTGDAGPLDSDEIPEIDSGDVNELDVENAEN